MREPTRAAWTAINLHTQYMPQAIQGAQATFRLVRHTQVVRLNNEHRDLHREQYIFLVMAPR